MNRWVKYVLIGLGFGVLDFGFMELVSLIARGSINGAAPALQVLAAVVLYGAVWLVWLIPLAPLALSEMRISGKPKLAALTGIAVWAPAMAGYYLTYAAYLLLIGAPNMEHLLLRNRFQPNYWWTVRWALQGVVLGQFLEWVGAAIVLGAAAGWLCARWYRKRQAKRAGSADNPA
ncbi:MAG: hypothetical protein LLG44_04570 [Chloroflexi bacterium]|nr:hypothetical protein [Chloroflexota bacterium]